MSADSLLHLLRIALADHERERGKGLRVISVVDEDLAQDHDVINWVMRRAGGAYINCDTVIDAQVAGVADPDLASVVQNALSTAGLPFPVVIDEQGGVVRARAETPRGPELPFSKGQRAALAVVASLFWADFHQHSLGALSLYESDWDLPTFKAVWELLVAQLPGRRVGTLETLLVFSSGPFKTTRHCASDASVRYVVREGRLNVRKRPSDLEAALGNLVEHRGRQLVLFLGAGFSYSSEMPLGDEARNYALKQFFSPGRYQDHEVADRFYEWIVDNDRLLEGEVALDRTAFISKLTLERVLREEFYRKPRADSPTLNWLSSRNQDAARAVTAGRSALKKLIESDTRLVILTVNFDTFVEEDAGSRLNVIATSAQFETASAVMDDYLLNGGTIPYVKLHGTLGDRRSIVADVESTALGLTSAATDVIKALTNRTNPIPWIYIGYSMRDPDVSQVLALEWFPAGAIESWVDPLPPDSVRGFAIQHRSARWRQASVPDIQQRCITETADRFLARLAEVWLGVK